MSRRPSSSTINPTDHSLTRWQYVPVVALVQRGKGSPSGTGLHAGVSRAVDGGRKANPGREAH